MRNRRLYSGDSPEAVQRDLLPLVDFQGIGRPLAEVERLIESSLLPHLMQYDQVGFQSMYNSIPEPGATLGARVALAHNQGVTNWQVSPGGATLEELCCESLCRLFQLSDRAGATFMYPGTPQASRARWVQLRRRRDIWLSRSFQAGNPHLGGCTLLDRSIGSDVGPRRAKHDPPEGERQPPD
jgi:glutamate/tyrosine decarboxylase-like PLP-dependent enzyme